MEAKDSKKIDFVVHESIVTRLYSLIMKLLIIIVTLILLLVATNGAWLYYESQFEDVVVEQENTDGYNNIIGNDGDIINGQTDSQNP